jgi:tetratricopeptide (TPR) repeat protein
MTFRIFSIFTFVVFLALQACNQSSLNSDGTEKTPLELLNQEIENNSDNPVLYFKRSEIYKEKLDYQKAINDLQMAIQYDNKNLDYYLSLADLFLLTNQVQGTINSINSVLIVEPKHVEANLKMAELNLMFKRYTEAVKSANIVLEADPYNSKAHFIKGYTFKEFGDTAKSIGSFLEAVKQDPEFYNAYVELGILFSHKKDPICITYFNNAIEVNPTKTDSYYNLGIFYQENDMLNEAQDTYRKLNEIDPKFPYSYFNMGYILLEISGVPEEAAPYFAKAIENKPDYFEAHYNLGLCLERVGNMTEAAKSYQNALKYQQNYPKAIEALNRVDAIMHR